MEFTKELLFVGGFILVVVLFIQYLSYSKIKKLVKPSRKTRHVNNTDVNHDVHEVNQQHSINQATRVNEVNQSMRVNQQHKPLLNVDDIEIDTPDEDADSYVNPVHSEKHIDDDDEIEEK